MPNPVKCRRQVFEIERGGEVIAVIHPPSEKPTIRALAARLVKEEPFGDEFWAAVEEAHETR